HVSVHCRQAEVDAPARRDVLRWLAGAPPEPAVRRHGARQAGIPRSVAASRPRSHRGRNRSQLSNPSAAFVGVVMPRIDRVVVAAALLAMLTGAAPLRSGGESIASPNGRIAFNLSVADGQLAYRIEFNHRPAIQPSELGIVIDGVNLGRGVTIARGDRYRTDEKYAWRGVHSTAIDRSNGARIAVTHAASRTTYQVDVRVFDDAVAFRCVVPGTGRRIPDAAIAFAPPPGSTVWSHDLVGHY